MSDTIVKQPPGGDCHDLFGAEFKGSPCHHRVLKPPGGGSSDIFGNVEAVEQSPRRVRSKQYLQSSVFAANGVCEPTGTPRSKPGNDSHSRLFGPVESRPQCTPKNRMKSNIPFGLVGAASDPQESAPRVRRNPVTGDGVPSSDCIVRRSVRKRDGNPVTGDGYTAGNDEKDSPSTPATTTTNGKGSGDIRRNRVPPGGYSSGLW
ncbi:microtubule-associated protein Jupiter-like isoform X2 [Zootermopsis nevadensis]|uniref:microtubule-associated protein Jupiter-like isoform X2 n=1 Tax=Zootermopsis nevadensis TaxID=136037 RepID=UPI000B8E4B6D|nr:microtubule-associated protein Jupiter-like isoform X2 [Zootermopsis nevadensis]